MSTPAMDRLRHCTWACAAAMMLVAAAATAAPSESELEQKVKAAFLFNFARFTVWPPAKFAAADAPIQFCVLDDDALTVALDSTLRGKTIENRPVSVRLVARSGELRNCHVAYIGPASAERTAVVLDELAGSNTLSVYHGNATLHGGAIRFFLEDRKVRFEINIGVTSRENLELSSRLLSVASVVQK